MSWYKKISESFGILVLAVLITSVGNVIAAGETWSNSILGVTVIGLVAFAGVIVSYLPGFHKLPMVFWVSLVGVIVSMPQFPGNAWFVATTNHVNFLATCTPVLAYAGLSLGKDIEAFKRLSWRIVPVALAGVTGTFICSALLAQLLLHLEGLF